MWLIFAVQQELEWSRRDLTLCDGNILLNTTSDMVNRDGLTLFLELGVLIINDNSKISIFFAVVAHSEIVIYNCEVSQNLEFSILDIDLL